MLKAKVLVVDDNEAHASGLVELLELAGFDAVCAYTGGDALAIATSQSVDAVLLDLHLPDQSGFEVCRLLRADPATSNVAVVFHTGCTLDFRLEHGADAYLTYPVTFNELLAVINGCISRRRNSGAATTIDDATSEDVCQTEHPPRRFASRV